MVVKINHAPAVAVVGRRAGHYGIGEIIAISCTLMPATATIAGVGGIKYKVTSGGGTLTAANNALGTATFTARDKGESVKISAYSLNEPLRELASVTLTILAPTSLKFVKSSNTHHNQGSADVGFRGAIFLQEQGVSYQRLEIREGEFKGKGSGYYVGQNNLVHPATAVAITVVNGYQVNGLDTIYSGIQGAPWSIGKFEWNIPWQYRITGTLNWTTFAYANHVQEIKVTGTVSIAKFNCGPFSANVNDPTQAY